ncbi:flagellar biosynthesis anti-sigma factor FlgM [Armatimonas sp.]|uniref:flagellar biosynthesis anti-sigma factor FlgM n=1 Tax=Armatimonas sp. TaxID=1872638 RepID=UPI00286C0574|nr:flagellar biosynthesis anti-sigma factor FlgM [Armatimonas sp.]
MRVDSGLSVSAIAALRGAKNRTIESSAEGPDATVISQRAEDIQTAFDALKTAPDVRTDEVAELRTQIEQGTFQVDEDALAEKLLESHP